MHFFLIFKYFIAYIISETYSQYFIYSIIYLKLVLVICNEKILSADTCNCKWPFYSQILVQSDM